MGSTGLGMGSAQGADHVNLGKPASVHLDRPGHDTPDEKAATLIKSLGHGVTFSHSQVQLLQLRQRSGIRQQGLHQGQTQAITARLRRDVQPDQGGVMPLFDPLAPLQADHTQQ